MISWQITWPRQYGKRALLERIKAQEWPPGATRVLRQPYTHRRLQTPRERPSTPLGWAV